MPRGALDSGACHVTPMLGKSFDMAVLGFECTQRGVYRPNLLPESPDLGIDVEGGGCWWYCAEK